MPARKVHRTIRPHSGPSVAPLASGDSSNATNKSSILGGPSELSGLQQPAAPKHIPFNKAVEDNDLVFELRMFLFTILGAACQFLYLYRSVWWLPYTNNNYPINYFLIDPYLVKYLLVLLSRRLAYSVISRILEKWLPAQYMDSVRFWLRVGFFTILVVGLSWCISRIVHNYSIVNMLYLCYPISVYIMLFGVKIAPLFEIVTMNANGLPPLHACTNVASDIRAEVEELKGNFNNRVKQILFNSILNAYYCGLLPCCFVQSFVYYDVNLAAQHVGVIWIGCLTTYTVHALPMRYCDTLHRSALHLGYWDKVEPNSPSTVTYPWQDDILWPFGTIVQHGKNLYRSLGEVNVAQPGDSSVGRFYTIFWNPPLPFSVLLVVQGSLVLFQLFLLLRSYSCWYNIITTSLLLVFNYYTLYIVGRNFCISHKLYNLEHAMHEKTIN